MVVEGSLVVDCVYVIVEILYMVVVVLTASVVVVVVVVEVAVTEVVLTNHGVMVVVVEVTVSVALGSAVTMVAGLVGRVSTQTFLFFQVSTVDFLGGALVGLVPSGVRGLLLVVEAI